MLLADLKSFEKKLDVDMVHVDHLNAIAHRNGLYDGTQLNHPRVAHNLLGYKTDCTSFTKRTALALWVGGPPPNGYLDMHSSNSTIS